LKSASSGKYIQINKSIMNAGRSFDYDIYIPSNLDKGIELFKESGSFITTFDITQINTIKSFYINEDDQEKYKQCYERYLASISSNISFQDRSNAMYDKASKVLESIFNNPEALENYEKTKEVVGDFVEIVSDNEFTVKSLVDKSMKDYFVHTHSINVSIYALSLGAYLGLNDASLCDLGESALLHDLGKSKIDPYIIEKDGELTDAEFAIVKNHSYLGYSLCLTMGIVNKNVLDGIKYHHEKINGRGYPRGLKGNEIPLFARIIGICDAFDAMTSARSYKPALSAFEALKLMKTEMKNHFDINLINKMIMMFR